MWREERKCEVSSQGDKSQKDKNRTRRRVGRNRMDTTLRILISMTIIT